MNAKKLKLQYEARYFFNSFSPDIMFFGQENLDEIEYIVNDDEYFISNNLNDVVKIRDSKNLEIKKLYSETKTYKAYEKKILANRENIFGNDTINIHKNRYKYKLNKFSKLEIAKLDVNGSIYYSFCIESKLESEIESNIEFYKKYTPNALTLNGSVILGYPEFLRWLGSNNGK